jgi:hypothetical protein
MQRLAPYRDSAPGGAFWSAGSIGRMDTLPRNDKSQASYRTRRRNHLRHRVLRGIAWLGGPPAMSRPGAMGSSTTPGAIRSRVHHHLVLQYYAGV